MKYGDPLSPIIFNVVVDVVLQHWASLVEENAGGQGGRGWEVRHHGAFLYTDDGLVASADPDWLQGAFGTLTKMFNRVRLQKKRQEDDRDDLPLLLCIRYPVRNGVRAVDAGRGDDIQGDTEGKIAVFGLW